MHREIAPIAVRPATLSGISERMIVKHYEDNYGKAVRALDAVRRELAEHGARTTPGAVRDTVGKLALAYGVPSLITERLSQTLDDLDARMPRVPERRGSSQIRGGPARGRVATGRAAGSNAVPSQPASSVSTAR